MFRPFLRPRWRRKRAIVVSPDKVAGLLLLPDSDPNFDLITFSYDGSDLGTDLMNNLKSVQHFAFLSEQWGQSFLKLCHLVSSKYDVVCFMNSDLYVSISNMNNFFDIVDLYNLDFSQPSLSINSYHSHEHTLNIPGGGIKEVPFIEIMMPCLSSQVINEICRINLTTISGWGLDVYLFPYIQRKLKLKQPAVIHDCVVTHCKPVSSNYIYSDGLTAHEQMVFLRDAIKNLES